MRKLLFTISCLFILTSNSFAQDAFKHRDLVLNVGVGIGNTLHSDSFFKTNIPPIFASMEYCVKDNLFDNKSSIGVGGYLGYSSLKAKSSWAGDSSYKISDFVIGARGSLHYQFVEKLDTYAGLGLGYDIVSTSGSAWSGYSASSSTLVAAVYVGGRYYFTDSFAVNAEIGYDVAVLTLGISYKF